jgi:hypothetical protein
MSSVSSRSLRPAHTHVFLRRARCTPSSRPWHAYKCSHVRFFAVGRNGTGKSNFFDGGLHDLGALGIGRGKGGGGGSCTSNGNAPRHSDFGWPHFTGAFSKGPWFALLPPPPPFFSVPFDLIHSFFTLFLWGKAIRFVLLNSRFSNLRQEERQALLHVSVGPCGVVGRWDRYERAFR